MASNITADEARKELARRELARRRGTAPAQQATEEPSVMGDMLSSLGAGIRSGIEGLGGMAGDLNALGGRGASWLAEKVGASPETAQGIGDAVSRMSVFYGMPGSEQTKDQADELLGDTLKHQPQTTAGKYAKTAGEFIPAAIGGPGSFGRRLITQALLPSVGSETAGQMTEGTAAEPYARIAGALTGGLVPVSASKAISPMRISPERQAMVDVLRREGVPVTAGQATGSNALRYAESELGGGRAARMMDDQAEAFTDAAMRRAGASGRATPDNMAALNARLGQAFEDISARNTLAADQQLLGDMVGTLREYGRVLPTEQRQILGNIASDIGDRIRAGNGTMSGADYQTIRSRLTKRAQNARGSDNELAAAYRGLRDALDSAMDRSINPADQGAWAELRRQYGNMKVLERASTGAGENAAMGLISPAQLRTAAASGNRGAYARGEGDFSELAHAGQSVMSPLPNSGTAARTAARNIGVPFATSGVGGVVAGLPGALAGAAIPYVAGRALMSGPVQRYLTNQAAAGLETNPRLAAIIAALMGGRQAALPPPQ